MVGAHCFVTIPNIITARRKVLRRRNNCIMKKNILQEIVNESFIRFVMGDMDLDKYIDQESQYGI